MIICAHQVNFLPGLSVVEKIGASDACIWLDEVQFTPNGWSNRNRLRDGSYLTVPVEHGGLLRPLNRVRISEHGGWRRKAVSRIRQLYRGDHAEAVCAELARPYRLLVGMNLALLRIVLEDVPAAWHFQSHLDGGRAVAAVSDERAELLPISARLAMMVAELGGDTYLSGPSGFRYLDEQPFHDIGIGVRYFEFSGPNLCVLHRLLAKV